MDWKSIKKDLSNGLRDGLEVVMTGAEVAAKKASELTAEGKKKFKIYNIKKDIHELMAELGARVYKIKEDSTDVHSDTVVKSIIKKVDAAQKRLTAAENE